MYQSRESLNIVDDMVLQELFGMFIYLIEQDVTHLDYKVIVNHLKHISSLYESTQENDVIDLAEMKKKDNISHRSPTLKNNKKTKKKNSSTTTTRRSTSRTRKNTSRTRRSGYSTISKMRKIDKKYF